MMNDFWYQKLEPGSPFTQGDLISNCPVLVWPEEEINVAESDGKEILEGSRLLCSVDVVVMTQACDIENNNVRTIVLCPFKKLTDWHKFWEDKCKNAGKPVNSKVWKSQCNLIRNGHVWNLCMLNKDDREEINMGPLIVDFHEIFTLPISILESIIKQRNEKRIRLLPPYREHLSQAFARYFMRVGLPMPIGEVWQLTAK